MQLNCLIAASEWVVLAKQKQKYVHSFIYWDFSHFAHKKWGHHFDLMLQRNSSKLKCYHNNPKPSKAVYCVLGCSTSLLLVLQARTGMVMGDGSDQDKRFLSYSPLLLMLSIRTHFIVNFHVRPHPLEID